MIISIVFFISMLLAITILVWYHISIWLEVRRYRKWLAELNNIKYSDDEQHTQKDLM
jgi:hypothetical protein